MFFRDRRSARLFLQSCLFFLFTCLLAGLFLPNGALAKSPGRQPDPSPAAPTAASPGGQPTVRAVLFFSPYCGHCEYVSTEVLPPLFEKYGDRLRILRVDVSQDEGLDIFYSVLTYFRLEGGGVPFLVIDRTYLVGSVEIPAKLPGLIEQYLGQGGVDWPPIPGLEAALAEIRTTEQAAIPSQESPVAVETPEVKPGVSGWFGQLKSRFRRDLAGNTLAVVVLLGMIGVLAQSIRAFRRLPHPGEKGGQALESAWSIPWLSFVGVIVAGYLAYVETTQTQAVCGPVGDCNTVQQSEYARLFGVLPIGVLGVIGYWLILVAWWIGQNTRGKPAAYANLTRLGMTLGGVLFSIYLTFLEPFVIGATCAWCLTSAVLMTALFWLSLEPGKRALESLSSGTFAKSKKSK